MNSFQNAPWSFSLGTWFAVQIRVNLFLFVAALILWRHFGFAYGSALFCILVVSVLLHEFGHVWASRATGGFGDEILLGPFGGLAMVTPGNRRHADLITVAGGPAVNLTLCLAMLPLVYKTHLGAALTPWEIPISLDAFAQQHLVTDLAVLTFHLNLLLFLLNLIPACPLDGGQMLRSVLVRRLGRSVGREWSIKVGFVAGLLLAIIGLMSSQAAVMAIVVGIALCLMINAVMETSRAQMGELEDDSFLGYDFSQGYTSLERADEQPRKRKPGMLARWRQARKARKEESEQLQMQQDESQLDDILAKLHEQGMESLSESDKRLLKRASGRYKQQENESH